MEKGGERWSKPHVATLSLHSLFELRKCIEKGTIMLDMEASTLPQVVGELPAGITNTQITTLYSPRQSLTKREWDFLLSYIFRYFQFKGRLVEEVRALATFRVRFF